jgi:hypothetical protein
MLTKAVVALLKLTLDDLNLCVNVLKYWILRVTARKQKITTCV